MCSSVVFDLCYQHIHSVINCCTSTVLVWLCFKREVVTCLLCRIRIFPGKVYLVDYPVFITFVAVELSLSEFLIVQYYGPRISHFFENI